MSARWVGSVVGMLVDRSVLWGFGAVLWLTDRVVPAEVRDQADWLADLEAETEVLEPADFPDCNCASYQDADLDDHQPTCGARVVAELGDQARRWTELTNPHIAAARAFHRPNIEGRDGLWCWCGQFCLNASNHEAHVDQVIDAMLDSDERVTPTVRKHQK